MKKIFFVAITLSILLAGCSGSEKSKKDETKSVATEEKTEEHPKASNVEGIWQVAIGERLTFRNNKIYKENGIEKATYTLPKKTKNGYELVWRDSYDDTIVTYIATFDDDASHMYLTNSTSHFELIRHSY